MRVAYVDLNVLKSNLSVSIFAGPVIRDISGKGSFSDPVSVQK